LEYGSKDGGEIDLVVCKRHSVMVGSEKGAKPDCQSRNLADVVMIGKRSVPFLSFFVAVSMFDDLSVVFLSVCVLFCLSVCILFWFVSHQSENWFG